MFFFLCWFPNIKNKKKIFIWDLHKLSKKKIFYILTWNKDISFYSWAKKSLQMMTAAMKLKRFLLLGRKAMTNLDNILKSRDITLLTNVLIVKAMVCPVAMYRCESWTTKKAEHWRRCFQAVVLEKILESSLDNKKSNQSILKEINPKYSLEGLMLKLKLQHFGHLTKRTDSLEKTLVC